MHMQDKKAALPPALAKLPLEELQQFTLETLKKLKARDKKIAELNGALEKADAANGQNAHAEEDNAKFEALERQLQVRACQGRLSMLHAHVDAWWLSNRCMVRGGT